MQKLRIATEDDIGRIVDMYIEDVEDNRVRAKEFAKDLVQRFHTILCLDGEELCGTISWETRGGLDDGVAEVVGMGVRPIYRRKGIGTKLIGETIKQLRASFLAAGSRLRILYLFMEKSNEIAREFYQRLGFVEAAAISGMYPHEDAAIFVLRIGSAAAAENVDKLGHETAGVYKPQ
jgi:ribosomal protein S18 acetylase RimI-like enzyme